MFVMRIAGSLVVLSLVGCLGMYLIFRDRRYLGWAWRIGQFTAFSLLAWLVLYFIERVALVV
jgi:hypothetical protein